ncbi:hypothetical protein VPH35_010197 [Triticum aestivum]
MRVWGFTRIGLPGSTLILPCGHLMVVIDMSRRVAGWRQSESATTKGRCLLLSFCPPIENFGTRGMPVLKCLHHANYGLQPNQTATFTLEMAGAKHLSSFRSGE